MRHLLTLAIIVYSTTSLSVDAYDQDEGSWYEGTAKRDRRVGDSKNTNRRWYHEPMNNGDVRWSNNGDDGRYIATDEGKYIHIPNPYLHDDNPYLHDVNPYKHQDDPYKPEATVVDKYKTILTPHKDIPYYRPGYYTNNGIKIINQKHKYNEDNYDFKFETENKIRQQEKAQIENANTPDEGIQSAGFYEYIGPDGFLYRTSYTAGKEGFRPHTERLKTKYSGELKKIKIN